MDGLPHGMKKKIGLGKESTFLLRISETVSGISKYGIEILSLRNSLYGLLTSVLLGFLLNSDCGIWVCGFTAFYSNLRPAQTYRSGERYWEGVRNS